ncbi:MAG: SMC-Scp complex subunit ScpB [Promethearchaeota archaeon]
MKNIDEELPKEMEDTSDDIEEEENDGENIKEEEVISDDVFTEEEEISDEILPDEEEIQIEEVVNEETGDLIEDSEEEDLLELTEKGEEPGKEDVSNEDLIEDEGMSDVGVSELQTEPARELTKEELELELKKFQKNLIEAALYAAGKPLDVEILSTKLEVPKKAVAELLNELAMDYLERNSALIINQVGESFQMAIKSEYVEKVSKFATGGAIAERYLRTLTIIALKQPILKSMVIKLRGSGAYEHVKYLLDNDFIEAVKKGRSKELTTTDKYAEMFGLPKDKTEMKRVMINQLGMGDQASANEE